MSKSLKIKKAYIDSRYRTNDSTSDTDFKFELKRSIDLPDNCVCYIDDIQIPHTWHSVEPYNNKLFLEVGGSNIVIISLTPQNHTGITLASDLQAKLQDHFPDRGFTVTHNTNKGTLSINSNGQFRFVSDRELRVIPSSIRFTDGLGNTAV
jgi:hypothetical protein